MSNVHANYLLDVGRELRESAEEARRDAESAEGEDRLFAQGRATAYYEVVSLMHQQAAAFGLQPAEVGLQGIDPDRDLLQATIGCASVRECHPSGTQAGMQPHDDDHLVHATWNRRFWGFQILAFADHSYLIELGSDRRPPLMVLGWCRWYPCSPLDFPRFRRLRRS